MTAQRSKIILINIIYILFVPLICAVTGSAIMHMIVDLVSPIYKSAMTTGGFGWSCAIAALVARFSKFDISRTSFFIHSVAPGLILIVFGIIIDNFMITPAFLSIGTIYPAVAWFLLRLKKRDQIQEILSKIKPVTKDFYKKRLFRFFIAFYFFWLFLLVMTNNFEFHTILEFDYYNEQRGWFLVLLPLVLGPISLALYKWCKRGE